MITRARLILAVTAALCLSAASCTGLAESTRPDPSPALSDAQGTTARAVAQAHTAHESAAERVLAEARRQAVQHWIDSMQNLAEALERAVPRTRAPERDHFPQARQAIERTVTLAESMELLLPEHAARTLAPARAHAAQAAWAGEVLLERSASGNGQAADRAWEAVVLHWNNWREALLEAIEDEHFRTAMGGDDP